MLLLIHSVRSLVKASEMLAMLNWSVAMYSSNRGLSSYLATGGSANSIWESGGSSWEK